jgi:hypothetical protein
MVAALCREMKALKNFFFGSSKTVPRFALRSPIGRGRSDRKRFSVLK